MLAPIDSQGPLKIPSSPWKSSSDTCNFSRTAGPSSIVVSGSTVPGSSPLTKSRQKHGLQGGSSEGRHHPKRLRRKDERNVSVPANRFHTLHTFRVTESPRTLSGEAKAGYSEDRQAIADNQLLLKPVTTLHDFHPVSKNFLASGPGHHEPSACAPSPSTADSGVVASLSQAPLDSDIEFDDPEVSALMLQQLDALDRKVSGSKDEAHIFGDADISVLPELGKQRSKTPSEFNVFEIDSVGEVFDPSLRRSSPLTAHEVEERMAKQQPSEDLLDEDIDWREVMKCLACKPTGPSSSFTSGGEHDIMESSSSTPFKRPPFPSPLRERSPITGLSVSSRIRVCFRIQEILAIGESLLPRHPITQGQEHFGTEISKKNSGRYESQIKQFEATLQDLSFELYARVAHSHRERGSSLIQHFEFIDLYKDKVMDLSLKGTLTLTGSKRHGVRDRASAAFLQEAGEDERDQRSSDLPMCRCLCKLKWDNVATIGWNVKVLSVRLVSWEEITLIKRVVATGP